MAIYHLHAQVISRAKGRSALAASAYRAAERLTDSRTGLTHNFGRKKGVVYTAILTPSHAPAWMRQRASLWAGVEAKERRCDAQVAREIQVALPQELTLEQRTKLLEGYVQTQFVDRGMVADVAVHMDNPDNPHAHIMLTMRAVVRGQNGQEACFGAKERGWNARAMLLGWREEWSHACNKTLEREGLEVRVDHRSYADRGIDLEPTPKLEVGRAHGGDDGRRFVEDRRAEHAQVVRKNGEAILRDPSIALSGITYQRATFTRSQMGRYLTTYTADATQFQACLESVMGSSELVRLPSEEGEPARFTTQAMLQTERALRDEAQQMQARHLGHHVPEPNVYKATRGLSEEARGAATYALNGPDLVVIQGYAGAGKSSMLAQTRQAWEASGYRVLGASLSGKAAEGLEETAGISSRSLAAWEYRWDRERDLLQPKDVFVIDEAGLVGTRQMQRVLSRINDAGAKAVLVGDSQQLQAIEAGAPLRMLSEEVGHYAMVNVQRQHDPEHRAASVALAQGKAGKALEVYANQGAVLAHANKGLAVAEVVEAWDRAGREHPQGSRMMLAYRRVDVAALNAAARAQRIERGELGTTPIEVDTERGTLAFAVRDRIAFLRNDPQLGVKNGTLGTVTSLEGGVLWVRLEGSKGPRTLSVDPQSYKHLDHGYAITVHKAQGVTVDRAFVLASSHFDRHTSYVALTRHREAVQLHYSKEELATFEALRQTLSRTRLKDMVLDHLGQSAMTREPAAAQKPGAELVEELNRDAQILAQVKAARLRAEAYAACQSRIEAYEQAEKRLTWERSYLEQAQPKSLEEIQEQHPRHLEAQGDLRRAQEELELLKSRAVRQREEETQYGKAHPIRTRWKMEAPRATWKAFWAAHEPRLKATEAKLICRQQAKEALHIDPDWQKTCVQKAQESQARLEAKRQAAVMKAQSLERQRPQYAQDREKIAKMKKEDQERENKITSDDTDQISMNLVYHRELRRAITHREIKAMSR